MRCGLPAPNQAPCPKTHSSWGTTKLVHIGWLGNQPIDSFSQKVLAKTTFPNFFPGIFSRGPFRSILCQPPLCSLPREAVYVNCPPGFLAWASGWVQPVGGGRRGKSGYLSSQAALGWLHPSVKDHHPLPRLSCPLWVPVPAPSLCLCLVLVRFLPNPGASSSCWSHQPHQQSFLLMVSTDSSHFPTSRVPSVFWWGPV